MRDKLVPINRKWPIAELLEACRALSRRADSRRITFEYAMLKGVNDSDADARELVRLLTRIPAKVNLIPFNPWPGAPYECSSNNRIHRFAEIVERRRAARRRSARRAAATSSPPAASSRPRASACARAWPPPREPGGRMRRFLIGLLASSARWPFLAVALAVFAFTRLVDHEPATARRGSC